MGPHSFFVFGCGTETGTAAAAAAVVLLPFQFVSFSFLAFDIRAVGLGNSVGFVTGKIALKGTSMVNVPVQHFNGFGGVGDGIKDDPGLSSCFVMFHGVHVDDRAVRFKQGAEFCFDGVHTDSFLYQVVDVNGGLR